MIKPGFLRRGRSLKFAIGLSFTINKSGLLCIKEPYNIMHMQLLYQNESYTPSTDM